METSYEPSGFPIDDHGEDHATERAEEMIARGERPPHYTGPMPGDEDDPNRCQVSECEQTAKVRRAPAGFLCDDCYAVAREIYRDYLTYKVTGEAPSYVRQEVRP